MLRQQINNLEKNFFLERQEKEKLQHSHNRLSGQSIISLSLKELEQLEDTIKSTLKKIEHQKQDVISRLLAQIKEQKTCILCIDKDKEIVFVPCGHLCTCSVCAQSLIKCPVCRSNIQQRIKTFI